VNVGAGAIERGVGVAVSARAAGDGEASAAGKISVSVSIGAARGSGASMLSGAAAKLELIGSSATIEEGDAVPVGPPRPNVSNRTTATLVSISTTSASIRLDHGQSSRIRLLTIGKLLSATHPRSRYGIVVRIRGKLEAGSGV
jgi:hypothetical protein